MSYHDNILRAIGRTPLVRLSRMVGPRDATVLVKPEYMNPGGSIKDRMALYILEKAEREGKLRPGGVIVENTSGNTGVGLAMAAALKGYRCVFTIPDKMSAEKVNTLKAFGAEVHICPTNVPADHPDSYYETAKRLVGELGAFFPNQYHNPVNIEAHYHTTGPEILDQTEGNIDYFVAGLGTGGTMSGAGKFLKDKVPTLKNVGVDPEGSVYHSLFHTGKLSTPHVYKVEGIGEDMACAALDLSVLDDVRQVNDRQCFIAARRLAREEGIFGGGSAGAAVHVALQIAKEAGPGKVVVAILPDGGRAYISKFYSDEWMRDMGFLEPDPSVARVEHLLQDKPPVVVATVGESTRQVVLRMQKHGFSQLPIVNGQGRAVGMVHESDVLGSLLSGDRNLDQPIEPAALQGVVSLRTPIHEVEKVLADDNVAVVIEDGRVIGIVTKIDLITHLANPPR
ncbi:MAG: putative cystathionine beta-synthase [Deltaproteobacteria bacterium ADurb.Bin207]|nr:MAG: putative cystathionine beta-synthase [Deltaproteobacteria bacterium ADurb.Bin207]